MSSPRPRSWLAWLVIIGSALLAVASVMDLVPVAQSTRWPTVPGAIISSVDQMEIVAMGGGRSGMHPVRQRRLRLTYTYEVGGQQHQSSQVNRLADYVRAPGRHDLETYATGRSVVVHYDPTEPSTAVIDTSLPWLQCVQLVLATLVLVLTWRSGERAHSPRRHAAAPHHHPDAEPETPRPAR